MRRYVKERRKRKKRKEGYEEKEKAREKRENKEKYKVNMGRSKRIRKGNIKKKMWIKE